MPNVSKVSPATRIAPAPVIGEWTRGREDAGSSGLQSDEHRRLLLVPNGGVLIRHVDSALTLYLGGAVIHLRTWLRASKDLI